MREVATGSIAFPTRRLRRRCCGCHGDGFYAEHYESAATAHSDIGELLGVLVNRIMAGVNVRKMGSYGAYAVANANIASGIHPLMIRLSLVCEHEQMTVFNIQGRPVVREAALASGISCELVKNKPVVPRASDRDRRSCWRVRRGRIRSKSEIILGRIDC
jgi:hypothetical protein